MKRGSNKYHIVGADTNFFIYYFQRHPQFGPQARKLLVSFFLHHTRLITSTLTLTELFSFHTSERLLTRLEHEFTMLPNLVIHDVDQTIAYVAAQLRKEYGFTVVDATQIATAIEHKADTFITNDKKLTRCKEISVRLISSV